jgi:glycine hydroxymethyltransferase
MHIIAAKAVAFKEALEPSFKEYAVRVVKNAKALAAGLMSRGLELVSGGTDNHMMLVDLRNLDITGKDAERWLDGAGVTCNKNSVPFETQSPMITSGLRIGTPAVTTRGLNEADMEDVAGIIADVIHARGQRDDALARVQELTEKYPLY